MFRKIIKMVDIFLIIIFVLVTITSCSFKAKKEPKNKEDAVFTYKT